MKNILFHYKSSIYLNILKLMGVCGIFVLFSACYGTPKSAWAPKHEKNSSKKEIKSTDNTGFAKAK